MGFCALVQIRVRVVDCEVWLVLFWGLVLD